MSDYSAADIMKPKKEQKEELENTHTKSSRLQFIDQPKQKSLIDS